MAEPNGARGLILVLSSLLVFVLGASCMGGAFVLLGRAGVTLGPPAPSRPASRPTLVSPRGDLAASEQTTVELFQRAAPSVVFITSISVRTDSFRRRRLEQPEGTGSGFVWDADGHIVTNFHVIQGADAAEVTFADQHTYRARLVGYVGEKDLAVLRVDATETELVPLPLGTSGDLQVGQAVFAIGNPFGFDHTLSTGVISGLDREITGVIGRPIAGMVQTDAAINPGNSGGPLLDSAGRLVGVNTAIYSPSGAYAGIGFAVPVDTVVRIVPQLIQHGRVTRPGLGVRLAPPQHVARWGLAGALVWDVEPGSPAAQAGLRPSRRDDQRGMMLLGDLIVALDDTPIRSNDDLFLALDEREVGQAIRVTLENADGQRTVSLTLGAYYAE